MLKREQVKEVITALVKSGWLLARHAVEATNDVMKGLEQMEEEKPAIVRAYERMESATNETEALEGIVAFNEAFDKLSEDVRPLWADRRKAWIKSFMGRT